MNLENFVTLFVRLFAIALGIYLVLLIFSWVPFLLNQEMLPSSYAYVVMLCSFILLSVYLWFFPKTVAKRLVSFEKSEGTDLSSATAEQIQSVALTTLGLFLLYNVISDIFYWFALFVSSSLRLVDDIPLAFTIEQISSMVATGVELIFVIVLLFGRKGIINLIHKIRA